MVLSHFRVTFGKVDFEMLWGHLRYTKVALGRSWSTFGALGRHSGDTLASFLAYEGVFGPFRARFEVA